MPSRRGLVVSLSVFALLSAACGGGGASPAAPAKSGGPQASAGDPAKGKELFAQTCSSCHGPDAKGLPNLGKNLVSSSFIKSQSNADLVAFIKKGRPASDPANTTKVDMPPKGGNPALTDAQLADIVAYLKSLQ